MLLGSTRYLCLSALAFLFSISSVYAQEIIDADTLLWVEDAEEQDTATFDDEDDSQCACECEVLVLTLESALIRALNDNRQLLNVIDSTVNAHYQVQIANSEYDLKIEPKGDLGFIGGGTAGQGLAAGAGVSLYKKFAYGTSISVTPFFQKDNNLYHADLNAKITQPLLRGFGREYTMANVLVARFQQRMATRTLYQAQTKLILRTVSALYEVTKARQSLVLNEQSYQRVTHLYEAAKRKVRIGLSEPLDIYRAEIEMRQAEDDLTAAVERFQEAEDALRDILAIEPEVCIEVDVPLIYTGGCMCIEEAISIALGYRVELDQAEDNLRENERLVRHAKEKLWPQLDLVLDYSNCGGTPEFTDCIFRNRETRWGMGFTTSKNINPRADKLAYEKSLLAREDACRNIEQTIANVSFEVKRAIRHLERSIQRIEIQEKLIHTAKGELRLARMKFDRGMANNFDVIQSEKALRNAQLSHWNAVVEHIVGEYQLRASLGLLLDKPFIGYSS